MQTTFLKAKLHRARVTHSELEYGGSCAIDDDLLDYAGIHEYEQIQIYNVTNGERFTTYVIRADAGSGVISVNGAAARLACPGDILIICSYVGLSQQELASYKPKLVYLNEKNKVIRSSDSTPIQAA